MLIVLVGPSACGKSTLATNLYETGGGMQPLPSYTTRLVRQSDAKHPGELTQVSNAEFDAMKARGEFIWTVKPFERPYRYGTRGSDVMEALKSGTSVAVLTGEAPAILYGYVLGTGQLYKVAFFYLFIDDYAELRRRHEKDPSRQDIEDRLLASHAENQSFMETPVPYYTIDATQSESRVVQTVLAIFDKLSPRG